MELFRTDTHIDFMGKRQLMAVVLAALIALLGLRFFERIIGIVISPAYFIACTGIGFFISIILAAAPFLRGAPP